MRYILVALFLTGCAGACDSQNISACGRACLDSRTQMAKWSPAGGCVCKENE